MTDLSFGSLARAEAAGLEAEMATVPMPLDGLSAPMPLDGQSAPMPLDGLSAPMPFDAAADPALAERRMRRERLARKAAERLLDDKSRELFEALQHAQASEYRLQMALWASGEGIWEWHQATRSISLEGLSLGGLPLHWNGRASTEVVEEIHPDDRAAARLAWQLHLNGSRPEVDMALRLHHAGRYHWIRVRGRKLNRDDANAAPHMIGTIKDISAQRDAEESLRMMAHAFASMRDGLAVVDAHWRVVEANEALCRLLRLPAGKLIGQSLQRFVDLGDLVLERLPGQDGWRAERVLVQGDQRVPVEVTATSVLAEGSAASTTIIALRDIRLRHNLVQRLQRLATVDRTTGLPNRQALEEALQHQLGRGAQTPDLGILFIGIDSFKVVNSSFGHDIGDAALKCVGEILAQNFGPPAVFGRWGSDKFMALLPLAQDEDAMRRAARQVQELLRKPVRLGPHEVAIGVTMGAVLAPRDGGVVATLLRRAETALYAAKDQCRGQLLFYDLALEGDAQRRLRMLSLLRTDADRAGFRFAAQSKFDREGRLVGAELLMRWATDSFGAVSPAEFIPLAEQVGLIHQIGRQALHAAARVVAQAQGQGIRVHMAVNLSPRQLQDPDIAELLVETCRQHGVEPASLELEVTESAFVNGMGSVQPLLYRLKSAGFQLALDDFGTGYSSLSYLQSLPFDKVKIDRSFVLGLERNERGRPILKAIVDLCRALGMTTVAEGVETREQFEALRDLGVDEFQGYLFAKPVFVNDWLLALAQAQPPAGPPAAPPAG